MNILIAEDNTTDRLILKRLVEKQGHKVFEATNGEEALDLFKSEQPDIILLDVMMPKLNGFTVAQTIKNDYPDLYIPIIFITSLTDTEFLVKCIEVGGDDFFTKPFNKIILQAKIDAFKRAKRLYQTVVEQKQEIEFHTEHLMQEQRVAKRIFDNIAHKGALDEPYIKYSVSPMSIFNGDILLAAKRPLGGLNVFLGDFTGHGLAASIGALPVSDIFFRMTAKGFELYEIINELNSRLVNVLPTGFFCCAAAAEIDFGQNSLKFWNGGLPEAYLINRKMGTVTELHSQHLPLGIISSDRYEIKVDIRSFNEGESLFVYSDGVIEVENKNKEMFGRERLLISLIEGAECGQSFETVSKNIKGFQGESSQGDDVTYLEIKNHKEVSVPAINEIDEVLIKEGPSDSSISIYLGPSSLKNYNPMPMIAQHLMEIGNLRSYQTSLFTILTELYSNALEHGVLRLSSKLKRSADGFSEYYRQREKRLRELKEGYIKIEIIHKDLEIGGVLTIVFEDSGDGFDYQSIQEIVKTNELSGRGYPLIYKFADSVEFDNSGARVTVVFKWKATRIE